MTSTTSTSNVDHWAFHIDSPFRGPSEICELAGNFAEVPTGMTRGPAPQTEYPYASSGEHEELYADYEESDTEGTDLTEAEAATEDLLEEATTAEHPLAAVFNLPRIAFDAMAKNAWPTAIAVAVGAGLRDVNTLTNMVFWFKHPDLIGQKIRPDQSDLAREWTRILSDIVKPSLAGGTPAAGPPPTTVLPPRELPITGGRTAIPSDGLRWYGPGQATPELMNFMRKVYALHRKRSTGDFVDTLPSASLDAVESGHSLRSDAAAKAREMLTAARASVAAAGLVPTVRIGILSAYRSADRQFDIWQGKTTKGRGGFPHYYEKTRKTRQSPTFGGEYSDDAAAYLAKYMGRYVAAPGYSNHQDGLALDLGTRKGTGSLIKLYEGSWFHNWMRSNARTFGFHPLASEAWHWTYRPGATAGEAPTSSHENPPERWPFESLIADEVTSAQVPAGRLEVPQIALLASHRGRGPDLILRWNQMSTAPSEIDVVVHLHGYSVSNMTLTKNIEVWSGLDLTPVDGATGPGRTRPTLTVLPRGHYTGVKVGKIYRYTFPALTTKDGLTVLIRNALDSFASTTGGRPPTVARLILTAHSGGGAPLLKILRRHDPHEVHVFDGFYQDPTTLAEWAARHIAADRGDGRSGAATAVSAMRVFAGPSTKKYSTRLHESILAKLDGAPTAIAGRYRVESSSLGHWQIARQYGWRVLSDPAADVPDAKRLPSTHLASEIEPSERLLELEPYDEAEDLNDSAPGGKPLWELGESTTEGSDELDNFVDLDTEAETDMAEATDEYQEDEGWPATTDSDFLTETAENAMEAQFDWTAEAEDRQDTTASEVAEVTAETGDEQQESLPFEIVKAIFRKPTVGFEFDVHYGFMQALLPPGRSMPVQKVALTTHSKHSDGFEVQRDGPRLEINTKPFESTPAGKQDLDGVAKRISTFATELTSGCSTASRVAVRGVAGSARPFVHAKMIDFSIGPIKLINPLPIAKLPVSDGSGGRAFDDCSVWASPQATITVKLSKVAKLVEHIQQSEGKGAGVALSGGPRARMGLQSEALYRALREVKKARTASTFSDDLEGFLILLGSYLWTSELQYRFPPPDRAAKAGEDYEPFGKGYLPLNVKTPFPQIFRALLPPADQQVFRDRFANGAARKNLFALARPAGAALADGDRTFLPTGPIMSDGRASVHVKQETTKMQTLVGGVVVKDQPPLGVAPSWNDLVDHTLDSTHRGWGDRLLVPLTTPLDVSKTWPRVLIELRRVGFTRVADAKWTPFMQRMHSLTQQLDQ